MKGGLVGILEVKSVIEDPILADAASRNSTRFAAWMSRWRCLKIKFSMNLLFLSISRAAAKSGFGMRESSALWDLALNSDNSNLSSKSSSSRYLKIAGQEWDLNKGIMGLSRQCILAIRFGFSYTGGGFGSGFNLAYLLEASVELFQTSKRTQTNFQPINF